MRKLYFLIFFVVIFGFVFGQTPPPPLNPPQVYFYLSPQPPNPDNLDEGSIERFNKTTQAYFGFLVLTCPPSQDDIPQEDCIFNFSEISFSHTPSLDSIPKIVFCNRTLNPRNCLSIVQSNQTKLHYFGFLSDPYKNLSSFSEEFYLVYKLNISKGNFNKFFPLLSKKYYLDLYPTVLSKVRDNNNVCKSTINVKDEDEKSDIRFFLPLSVKINNGSICIVQVVVDHGGYNASFSFSNSSCNQSLHSIIFRSNPVTTRKGFKPFGLDADITILLNSSLSPFEIFWGNSGSFNLSYNFSCDGGLKNYKLSHFFNVHPNSISFRANASDPFLITTTNFSEGFFLMAELEVIDSNGQKKAFSYKWNCTDSNCNNGSFNSNTQYGLINHAESFSPKLVNVSLDLNTSLVCPNGDKDRLIVRLKGGEPFYFFENKTVDIYDGPCLGMPEISADIYKSSKKEGHALSFNIPDSKTKDNEYVIIKLKNLVNSKAAVVDIKSTLFNGKTIPFSTLISTPTSFPHYSFLYLFYDLKKLEITVYPQGESKDKGIYRSFQFSLQRPILAIDKVLVEGQRLTSKQAEDLEKNRRLFVEDKKDIDIVLVFLRPHDIKDYDFENYVTKISSQGGCEGKILEKNQDLLKLNIRFKEYGCIVQVRGKVQSTSETSFSDFLQIKIYSKDVFVPQKPQSFCSEKEVITSQYFKFFLVGIALTISVIAIAFMAGALSSNPRLLEWSKREIVEVLLLGVFLILIGQLLSINCEKYFNISSISNLFGLEPLKTISMQTSIMEFAQNTIYYLSERVHSTIIILRRDIAYFHILGSAYTFSSTDNIIINEIKKSAQITGGKNENPGAYSYTYMGVFNFLLNLNNFYLFNILVHYFLLFFLSSSSGLIIFLLPIGLFFRSMPFLKNVGAALIAIGIGFYILFPAAYAVYGLLLENFQTKLAIHCLVFVSDEICKNPSSVDATKIDLFIKNKFAYLSELVEVGSFSKETFPYSDAIFKYEKGKSTLQPIFPKEEKSFSPDLITYFGLSALNFILAFFIPSIILLAVLAFVRDIASILGGDIDVSKLMYLA